MAYDRELADRIRALMSHEPDLTESSMFGGRAFLLGGHLAIAASREGGVLVRTDPESSEALVARSAARFAVMRGRELDGWLRVDDEQLRTTRQLARWVRVGSTFARSLPAKKPDLLRRPV